MSNTTKAIETLKKTDINSGLASIKTFSPFHTSEWVLLDLEAAIILKEKLDSFIAQEASRMAEIELAEFQGKLAQEA